jgi:hypothetical protein
MPSEPSDRLEFRATGGECFGFLFTRWLLTMFTCGIYGFWLASDWKRWLASRTYVHGEPLVYRSSFADFVLAQIVKLLAMLCTCGIYAPWALVKGNRYDWRHTTVADGRTCRFDGSGAGFVGTAVLGALLTMLTCGLGSPWAYAMNVRWSWSHTVIGGERVRFEGQVGDYLVKAIGGHILSMITFGIYLPWHIVNLQKWRIENAYVVRGDDRDPTPADPVEAFLEARAKDPKTWIVLGGGFVGVVAIILLLGAAQFVIGKVGDVMEQLSSGPGASSVEIDPVAYVEQSGDTPGALHPSATLSSSTSSFTQLAKAGVAIPASRESELLAQSCDELWAQRNWVYARHGYAFTTARAQNYFAAFPDYTRDAAVTKNTVARHLNTADKANVDLLKNAEKLKGCK